MKVELSNEKVGPDCEVGALLYSDGELYILAKVLEIGLWVAICLNDGEQWCNPNKSLEIAVEGLEPYLGSAVIGPS